MSIIIISIVAGLIFVLLGVVCLVNAKKWAATYPGAGVKTYKILGYVMFVIAAGMVIGLNIVAYNMVNGPYDNLVNYHKAKELYEAGEYDQAAELFFPLYYGEDPYRDSEEMFCRCYYDKGNLLLAEKQWGEARNCFDRVDTYLDAQDLIALCEAQLALNSMNENMGEYLTCQLPDLVLDSQEKYSLGNSKYGEIFTTAAHFSSHGFAELSDEDKLTVFEVMENTYLLASGCSITSGGSVYEYQNSGRENQLKKDGETVLTRLCVDSPTYVELNYSIGDCSHCNGTGYVRYYYGDSDLEAILTGHDPFTTGKCTSCNGTGTVTSYGSP